MHVGVERSPVLVIEPFLRDPQVLIEAAAHSAFDGVTDTFYPGVRAPIAPIYCFAVRAFLGALIAQAFDLAASTVAGELAHFSLVTTPPAQLKLLQRLPHVDSTNPKQLAVLHYLSTAAQGGTSFYRHRATGFEYVDQPRQGHYQSTLNRELVNHGPPASEYIHGDSALFERMASFEATFNRVLIYRSMNLHSADIAAGFGFDADPRSGRLTANTFLYYR